jgi:hypothetical protein
MRPRRSLPGLCVGVVIAGLIGDAARVDGAPSPERPATIVERRTAFDGAELLALSGGELLVWSPKGRAQLRRVDGTWSDETRLPLDFVRFVERDQAGFLAVGRAAPSVGQVAVLFDADAHEMRRWTFGHVPVYGVVSGRGGRRVAARSGTIELHDDGTLGVPQPYPQEAPEPVTRAPTVVSIGDSTVICWGADRSLLGHAAARCRRLEAGGWQFEADFVESPVACGEWLIARTGPAQTSLSVYSLSTGKLRGRASYTSIATVACTGRDALLVHERTVSLARLPTLAPAWTRTLDARGAVRSIAVLPELYAATSGASLWLLKRAD